jgi:heterodisulfide reductase subunit A
MRAKVGVYICECGPNIAEKIDIDGIIAGLSEFDGFGEIELVVKRYGFLCSKSGKEFLEEEIRSLGLTHLVIGACSPRDHDSTFKGVCSRTDLNPYLYRIINIREHCSWVIDDVERATEKAGSYLRGGIARVLRQSELFENPIDVNPDVLVIGGGVTGMQAALSLAAQDRRVSIVERSDRLGGRALELSGLSSGAFRGSDIAAGQVESVLGNPYIDVFLNTRVSSVIGFLGNFVIELLSDENGTTAEINSGAIIAATGCADYDPTMSRRFDYSASDDVYSSLGLSRMLSSEGGVILRSGTQPKNVALIHCAGRDELNYCSGICCGVMLKTALLLKEKIPGIDVTEFYRDICVPPHEGHRLYESALEAGVDLVRVESVGLSGTTVRFRDRNGTEDQRSFDMVVTAPALIPSPDAADIAELLGIPLDETGFFQEAHRMTDPSGTTTDGVFIAGAAQGPMGILDSMRFARASAGLILTRLIIGEKLIPEVAVSEILEAYCTGCGNCLEVCVYGAIYSDVSKGVSVVNEAICMGCGNCFGSCPSGALRTKHFTNTQLYREVDEALR